ncbi:ATP-grasp domain-containing protein [Prosthecodimorpha staleyi]|uniref:ATP-grasp domain-containing protein n=1 Tax=Prosthecodimorpha staleyi TaxID=2840188 RepID=A0A947GF41_9HYPH|nr:ATP-grasp domain-containing protein [Prosthecodimorpha staleyi]MBT9292727.1 ATP-grasp domain-containing protein [Prosthecodimorpha staleyi]
MHWVVQEDFLGADVAAELSVLLERAGLRHDFVRLRLRGGGLEPEIAPGGPVVVIGSVALVRIGRARGWAPGGWLGRDGDEDHFSFEACRGALGDRMLNVDGRVRRFAEVTELDAGRAFIRPADDGKAFAGAVVTREAFSSWRAGIAGPDAPWPVAPECRVVVAPARDILSETRFIVVDGQVVAGSLYRRGGQALSDGPIDDAVAAFAREVAAIWTPDRVVTLDVAQTSDGPKVIEFNNFNSARWYAVDPGRIVAAIEAMATCND